METATERRSIISRIGRNIRARMLAGILVMVPIGITVWILWFFFRVVDRILQPVLEATLGYRIPGLGLILTLILLYGIGLFASWVLGRRLIHWGEAILKRIPLVKNIYTAVKQVVETLSGPRSQAFKRVVLVEFPRPGIWAVALVTGEIYDSEGKKLLKLLIPTALNLASGSLELVPEEQVRETNLSVENAIKMVVSGGLLSPDKIDFQAGKPPKVQI